MSEATCKTCPWWHSPSEKCRCNPPTVVPTRRTRAQATSSQWTEYAGSGYCPHTAADFWCGEHPDRRPCNYAEVTEVTP